MKYKLILTIILIAINTNCFAQWKLVYPMAYKPRAIEVVDSNTLFFTSDYGDSIYKSTDGGLSFQGFPNGFSTCNFINLYNIHFVTNQVGYASGGASFCNFEAVTKTIDGGLTWDSVYTSTNSEAFRTSAFADEQIGVFQGAYRPQITNDGGHSFINIPKLSPDDKMLDAQFISGSIGFVAVGHNQLGHKSVNRIFQTNSAGANWNPIYDDTFSNALFANKRISHIQFVDMLHGFAVGSIFRMTGFAYPDVDALLFLKTIDGGATWHTDTLIANTTNDIYSKNLIFDFYFANKDTGFICMENKIYKTVNGGINWSLQTINNPSKIYKFKFLNSEVGYAIGDSGIYKTTTGGNFPLAINQHGDFGNQITVMPNPATNQNTISFTNKHNEVVKIILYDIQGKIIAEVFNGKPQIGSNAVSVNTSALSDGVYFYEIKVGSRVAHIKFIKQ